MVGTGYYNISKAALDMVTKQFAIELGPHQIRVNSVNPSSVATPSFHAMPGGEDIMDITRAKTPLKRVCTEEECCVPVMYLLSEQASMVTGITHVIDGGLFSCAPW